MTSLFKKEINCPYCGEKIETEVCESVNAKLDPELKEKLLNNEINNQTCPKCNRLFVIDNPILYNDEDKNVMVWIFPEFRRAEKKSIEEKILSDDKSQTELLIQKYGSKVPEERVEKMKNTKIFVVFSVGELKEIVNSK